MRNGLAVAACGLLLLAGCNGGSVPGGGDLPGIENQTQPPVAIVGEPYGGTVGTSMTFYGNGSIDPQGQTLTFAWTFGDGGTGTGATPTHTFAAAGDYVISLTVTDVSGLTSNVSTTALISIAQPGSTNGVVYDGKQPIAGAHVYLLAANTTGYGKPSVSLFNGAATGHSDAIGGYILTGANGGFAWTTEASCTPGTQVYVFAQGGAESGVSNPATTLMALLGPCPNTGSFSALPYIWVNEVSTVAAAYAIAGFATDALHVSSSGSALAQVGIANAFANAANISALAAGVAYAYTPGGNGIVPQAEMNTLANILSACVGSGSATSSSCTALFANAVAMGSPVVTPTDTATAAINIAHNPSANVPGLYALMPSSPPFEPVLAAAPHDLTLAVAEFYGGMRGPNGIAVDAAGNVWVTDLSGSRVSEFQPSGLAISSINGYTGGGLNNPAAIAIDLGGNAWVGNLAGSGESEFAGYMPVSASGGFSICAAPYTHAVAVDASNHVWFANQYAVNTVPNAEGVVNSGCVSEVDPSSGAVLASYGSGYFDGPFGMAIDTAGNVWVANQSGNSLTELSSSGVLLSPFAGFGGGGLDVPDAIAIDGAGNVWVVNAGGPSVSKFSSTGTALSPSYGFVGGGLSRPESLAIDGAGNVWVANSLGNSLSEFSSSGAVMSPSGFTAQGLDEPNGIAIDGSGDVWVTSYAENVLLEFVGAASPVVTPLAEAVKNSALGARP